MQVHAAQAIAFTLLLLTGAALAQQPPDAARTLSGHLGAVTMADFTPDGAAVGTSSADHLVKLWNASNGEELVTLTGHTAPVSSIAISPDGRILASGAQDNTIKLWDVPWTKPLRVFSGHQAGATSLALNGEASLILSAGRDKSARLWDRQNHGDAANKAVVLEGHAADVTAAAYRADQHQIATADATGFIRLWRTIDYHPEGTLGAHQGEVTAVFYHTNNLLMISTGADGLAKVWQLPIVAPHSIAGQGPGDEQPVDNATISADGQLSATAGMLNDRPAIVIRKVADGSAAATLPGHAARITSLAFNSNHTRLVSASEDTTVRVWDISGENSSEILKYTAHEGAVRAVAFSDAATVVSAGAGKTIHHWSLADGKLVRRMEGHTGEVHSLAVSATTIASAAADGTIRLWNKSNGQLARSIEHGSPVKRIAFSADSSKLASWGDNQQLKLWQAADGKLLTAVDGVSDLTSLAFSPNQQQIAATTGNDVRVWQVSDGGELQFFPEHGKPTRAVSYLPDSKTLISVDSANGWRRSTVSAVRSIVAHEGGVVDAAVLQSGNLFATVGGDGTVKQWNTSNGRLSREIKSEEARLISLAVSNNSQYIAAGADDGRVFVWNPGNGSLAAEFKTPAAANALSFSDDRLKLAVSSVDQRLSFFGLNDKSMLQQYPVDSPIRQIAFLPDNKSVVAAHDSGTIAEWAYASPAFTRSMTGHSSGIFNLVFTGDGETLVSASADRTVRLWDVARGRQLRSLSGHQGTVFGLALSPDSSLIVSAGGDSTIRLWDLRGGRQLKQIDAPGALYTVAVHPDGKTVAAAGIDRKVFIYDVFTGTLSATLEGHPDYVYRVTFNSSGRRLLSCGYGGHLIVWDFPSGRQLHATRAPGVLNSVAYAPDDSRVVVASDNGTAQLLDLPNEAR